MARNIAVILYSFFLAGFGDTAYFDNKEGNRLYGEQRYDEAVDAYSRAKAASQSEKGIDYNLGNSHFRTGDYGKAIESYTAATETGDAPLKENAMFNLGAAYYKAGEKAVEAGEMEKASDALKASVDQYKNLLAQNQGNNDVRHNLELALEKLNTLEQQKKEQEKEKEEGEKDSQDKEESENQGDDSKEKDEEERQKEEPEDKNGEDNKADEQKDDEQQDQRKREEPKEGMTPEKAQRILDAIENDEKALREKMKAIEAGKQPPVEKDW